MAKVDMSLSLKASAAAVWDVIGGFDDLPRWLPPIASSTPMTEGGKRRRQLTLHGGGSLVEELESHDDKARRCSYAILTSPLPIANYHAEISVHEDGPKACTVRWMSTFEAKGAPEADGVNAVRGVYQAGFDALSKKFGG
jgi:Polyketide cyclase / dehydrase and lipid transport